MDNDVRQILTDIRDRLYRIEKMLMGNGNGGIIREITRNTEFRENYQANYRILLGAVVGAVLAAAGSLAVTLLK